MLLNTVNAAEAGKVECAETRGRIPTGLGGKAEGAGAAGVRATARDIGERTGVGVEGGVGPADGGFARTDEEVVQEGETGGNDGGGARGSTNYFCVGHV